MAMNIRVFDLVSYLLGITTHHKLGWTLSIIDYTLLRATDIAITHIHLRCHASKPEN
jgi:hypothetical protein